MATQKTRKRVDAEMEQHRDELTREEGWELLELAAQRYLGMTATEFIAKWDADDLRDRERADVLAVSTLLPFVR